MSLMIDESTTISQLSSLIIYLRTKVPGMTETTYIFIDIVELKSLTAEAAKDYQSRELTDRGIYSGLLKCITKVDFILNLTLMFDTLQELSELNLELQSRDITLYSAQQKIRNQLLVSEERKLSCGPHYYEALKAVQELNFRGIPLEKGATVRHLERSIFYDCLKQRMENRLLQTEDIAISECAKVLDSPNWPENPEITYGETNIKTLCCRFALPQRQICGGFRECLMEKKIPASLLPFQSALKCVPISTSECERGFYQMNLIVSTTRASFHLSTVSNLMFIQLVGPPLMLFQPMDYVRSWFMKGRRLATDSKSKVRRRQDYSSHELKSVWKLL
ncbi:E3 SUMO-protein ligase KIAA1586-like [Schistocerca piceifrons]|uniref:E3 SUMO-protein ligase KIAA1586-like n=1 Tax=Schistocerca piceifrons TaxID=274613 RepID=UPI001F5FD72F|nr:E3 SUMO-protein ligase KIAA1586-like [Schistocerca piceifrons]